MICQRPSSRTETDRTAATDLEEPNEMDLGVADQAVAEAEAMLVAETAVVEVMVEELGEVHQQELGRHQDRQLNGDQVCKVT
jgi:hypothetical protein